MPPITEMPRGRAIGLGIAFSVLAYLLITVRDVSAKVMVGDVAAAASVLQVLFLTYLGSTLVCLPALLRGNVGALRSRAPLLQLGRAASLAGFTGGTFYALTLAPISDVYAVLFTTPFMIAGMASIFLGERVGLSRWSCLVIGLSGNVLALAPAGSGAIGWGLAVALFAAACRAVGALLVRPLSRAETNPLPSAVWPNAMIALATGAAMPFLWQPLPTWAIAVIVAAGFVGGLSQVAFVRSLTLAPAPVVAPFQYTQLIWSSAAGVLLLGETIGTTKGIGIGLVLFSGFCALLVEFAAARTARLALAAEGNPLVAGRAAA